MLVFVLVCFTLCPFCFSISLTRKRNLVAMFLLFSDVVLR